MFQYEASLQGNNPAFVKNALLQGLSGFGAQKAIVHSLKKYPKLLHAYLHSRNVLPA